MTLPPRPADTRVRVLASNDLLGTVIPLRASTGTTGTIDGVGALLSAAREDGPAIWVDSGDFTGGPLWSLGGGRGWDLVEGLPISAAAVGNHELDEGAGALTSRAPGLGFPLLAADLPIGAPQTAIVETAGGRVGVIGLTHPQVDRLSAAPAPRRAPNLIPALAEQLRVDGADWVLVLHHDGVTWWPTTDGTRIRARRLRDEVAGWGSVDAVLGGHTLVSWSGTLGDVVAGQADAFASSVLVVDLTSSGARIAGLAPVAPVAPGSESRSIAATRLWEADKEIIGSLAGPAASRLAPHRTGFLPDVVADALRIEGASDAALIFSSALFTQAPIDGSPAHLSAGDFSRLDLHRLFPFPDDTCSVIEVMSGELSALVKRHDAHADPTNRDADDAWWNWNRTPCGISTTKEEPLSVAVQNYTLDLISDWLGRRPRVSHQLSARAAFASAVTR